MKGSFHRSDGRVDEIFLMMLLLQYFLCLLSLSLFSFGCNVGVCFYQQDKVAVSERCAANRSSSTTFGVGAAVHKRCSCAEHYL